MKTPAFTFVTTFAGCGGSSTGYVQAGGKCLLAAEWDDDAVQTSRMNYPTTPVFHGDVTNLSVEHALKTTMLKPGELDVFDGSPPCQGFSTMGNRNLNDNRNQLFRQYARLLRGLQPKTFVMENVSGMVKGHMKLVFAEIMRELRASGYKVQCQLLNSKFFGVAQGRQRVIFIGVREDLGIEPSHPKAQTWPKTVREAFEGLPPSDNWMKMKEGSTLVREMNRVAAGTSRADLPDAKAAKKVLGYAPGFSWRRLSWDAPSPTLETWCGISHWHPSERRPITIEEAKRIGGFPDDYILTGPLKQQFKRIGNSVPPPMMRAVAVHIRDNILAKVNAQPNLATTG
jgi:DNA (cytosine-5)-methyltransferase 1